MCKTRTIYKLKKAFRELDIILTKIDYFYEVEDWSMKYLFIPLPVASGGDTFVFVAALR